MRNKDGQYYSSITVEDAFRRVANMKCNIDRKARKAAFALRSEIVIKHAKLR